MSNIHEKTWETMNTETRSVSSNREGENKGFPKDHDQVYNTSDWTDSLSRMKNVPLGIPTHRSDGIHRMYSPQPVDAFRQVNSTWTVSSTARHPLYRLSSRPLQPLDVNNNFDAFSSDVFLGDFQNVDTSQYNPAQPIDKQRFPTFEKTASMIGDTLQSPRSNGVYPDPLRSSSSSSMTWCYPELMHPPPPPPYLPAPMGSGPLWGRYTGPYSPYPPGDLQMYSPDPGNPLLMPPTTDNCFDTRSTGPLQQGNFQTGLRNTQVCGAFDYRNFGRESRQGATGLNSYMYKTFDMTSDPTLAERNCSNGNRELCKDIEVSSNEINSGPDTGVVEDTFRGDHGAGAGVKEATGRGIKRKMNPEYRNNNQPDLLLKQLLSDDLEDSISHNANTLKNIKMSFLLSNLVTDDHPKEWKSKESLCENSTDLCTTARDSDRYEFQDKTKSVKEECSSGGLKVLQSKDLECLGIEERKLLRNEIFKHLQMWNEEQNLGKEDKALTFLPSEEIRESERQEKSTAKSEEIQKDEEVIQADVEEQSLQWTNMYKSDEEKIFTSLDGISDDKIFSSLDTVPSDFEKGKVIGSYTPEFNEQDEAHRISPQLEIGSSQHPWTDIRKRTKLSSVVSSSEDRYVSTDLSDTVDAFDVNTCIDHVTSTTGSEGRGRKTREDRRACDEPRRPKNGFIRFSIEHRHKIAAQHPKLDNREISRILGVKWRKLDPDAKKCYENEFEKDIQSIREENPEWRYAPAKKLTADLIEPMPSRLRPRNNLKRKLPCLVRVYNKRQPRNRKKKQIEEDSNRELTRTWVQCDLCGKWSCLPFSIPPEERSDVWFCYCNPDPRYNSCSSKEDPDLKQSVCASSCSSLESSYSSSSPSSSSYNTYSNSNAHVLYREPSW